MEGFLPDWHTHAVRRCMCGQPRDPQELERSADKERTRRMTTILFRYRLTYLLCNRSKTTTTRIALNCTVRLIRGKRTVIWYLHNVSHLSNNFRPIYVCSRQRDITMRTLIGWTRDTVPNSFEKIKLAIKMAVRAVVSERIITDANQSRQFARYVSATGNAVWQEKTPNHLSSNVAAG